MGAALLLGGGFAFAAAVQPGPLQAFLLSRALATGWRRTLPAILAPILSDAPIAVIMLLLLRNLPVAGQLALRGAGGLLLLWLAWRILKAWRTPADAPQEAPKPLRTLGEGVLINFLNPNPWLGWALVLGPAFLTAWRVAPIHAFALVGAFYGILTATLAGLVLLASLAGRLGPRLQRGFTLSSGLLLAALGLFQLVLTATLFSK